MIKFQNMLFVWCLVLIISACSNSFNIELSEKAVKKFHRKLNSGDLDGIYAIATDEFIHSDSKENLNAFFNGIRTKLGKYKSSTL